MSGSLLFLMKLPLLDQLLILFRKIVDNSFIALLDTVNFVFVLLLNGLFLLEILVRLLFPNIFRKCVLKETNMCLLLANDFLVMVPQALKLALAFLPYNNSYLLYCH